MPNIEPGRHRRPMSAEQRAKLSAAQKAYVANDPRWTEHRAKLAAWQRDPARRAALSAAQSAYIANDPRWTEHRAKLAASQPRLTLMDNEIALILAMRARGRTFSYISEEIGLSEKVIRRELKALGITTARVKSDRRAHRGSGFWRCFDSIPNEAHP
jgi:hypothetical protein